MRRRITALLAGALLLAPPAAALAAPALGDIVFRRSEGTDAVPAAVFPHWVHRVRFKCHVCHEAVFVMKAGANAVTMDAIREGKFCGACHDGKTAFPAAFDTCGRCHRE